MSVSACTLPIDGRTSVRWADPASLAQREQQAIELLSPAERARFDATVSEPARIRLLWGRMLSRELVGQRVGVDPGSVTIDAHCADCGGEHGPPVVSGPDDARELSLSISGCHGMVVVAVGRRRRIGIDVEPRGGTRLRLQAIQEVAGVADDPLRHWTRVEAVLKADGRGLRVDPKRVRIDGDRARLDGVPYRLIEPALDPRFVVSVAIGPSASREAGARRA